MKSAKLKTAKKFITQCMYNVEIAFTNIKSANHSEKLDSPN